MRHPNHTEEFIRLKGGYKPYIKWCCENGYARMVPDKDGKLFPIIILKSVIKKARIGRNSPCTCDSGKKYKKCCGKQAPV